MAMPEIRPMTPADVDAATEAILRDDWGDRRSWFQYATTQPGISPFVAVERAADGSERLVGTGVASAHGPVGWVGTIWVDPGRRGTGLGRALTQATIDVLDAAGCRTLLLVATEVGQPLYERMGFSVATRYRILEAPGIDPGPAPADPGIRAFRPDDFGAMVALDRAATGEDRAAALARFATPVSTRVLEGAAGVRAFVIRAPWGGGATIAASTGDALRILDARRRASGPGGRVRVGLLEENAEGLAALAAAGLTPIWSAPRLVRGEPLDWHPDWIWGQFNHAMG
jgi:ribosomal protein S18 acetylase RimI-like enzyme